MMDKRMKIVILTAALLLILTAGIGMSAAYFTDYEDARGGAVIELGGQTKLTEDVKEGNKEVSISNTGDTDMIVRIIVVGDAGRITSIKGSDWNKGQDGAYYYSRVLPPGGSTGKLTVNVRGGSGDTDDFEIIVVHEGSRAVYTGSGEPGAEGQRLEAPDGWDAEAVAQIETE